MWKESTQRLPPSVQCFVSGAGCCSYVPLHLFNRWGKPSFLWDSIHLNARLNAFVILLAPSVCYYHSLLLLHGFRKSSLGDSSHCWDESPLWRKPVSPPAMCHYIFPLNSPLVALQLCSRCDQILKDIQHICDFHPPLGKQIKPE